MFARGLKPPYFAVIFANKMADGEGYAETAERMVELAQTQPGFLGVESARGESGFGITVSYWANEDALLHWKQNAEHLEAQRIGVERFYEHYELRVAHVTRGYSGPQGRTLTEEGRHDD